MKPIINNFGVLWDFSINSAFSEIEVIKSDMTEPLKSLLGFYVNGVSQLLRDKAIFEGSVDSNGVLRVDESIDDDQSTFFVLCSRSFIQQYGELDDSHNLSFNSTLCEWRSQYSRLEKNELLHSFYASAYVLGNMLEDKFSMTTMTPDPTIELRR